MQIRITLILLITSTFVLYAWGLPDNAAIRIFTLLMICFYQENYIFKILL